jgi:WD40 repeat protein
VQSLTFSPDGRRLASADDEGNLRIWDATGADRARE